METRGLAIVVPVLLDCVLLKLLFLLNMLAISNTFATLLRFNKLVYGLRS